MKFHSSMRLSAAVSLCIALSHNAALADFHYTVTHLPAPDFNTQVYDINEAGTVVGASQNESNIFYEVATYWKNGEYVELTWN